MLSVVVIWLYMLITCYLTGFGCLRIISGSGKPRWERGTDYLYAGIGAVTVYAQLFSIFWKVGLLANLVLVLLCILCEVFWRKELLGSFHAIRLSATLPGAAVILALFLLFAYGTSTGLIHYDSGLYHGQSIRWVEEYGVVPGLGNLHSRLAYNSAAFCLSALYSMAFLGGQSFHCCAGFLAFLLALACREAFGKGRVRRPRLSDFARIMGIYYLLTVFDEMVSPASDYFMVLLVFYIVIRWLGLIEAKEDSWVPYALLCLLGVVTVTVKLSGALILLLAFKPAAMLAREKRIGEILKYLGLGAGALLPFLIRNVILSGWLVYPFTAIDLFSFDFKIPKGVADYDAREIQVWGRGLRDVGRYEEPIRSWLPGWIKGLDSTSQLFLAMALGGMVLYLGFVIYALIKRRKDMGDWLHVQGTLLACFCFWLLSAPLLRYGCVFLWLAPVLVWGYGYLGISPRLDRFRVYTAVLVLLGAYKLTAFGIEVGKSAQGGQLLWQKDYDSFETIAYELHGYTFYYPAQGDRTGYRDFPASPVKAEDIFRGETIKEGFKDVIHQ